MKTQKDRRKNGYITPRASISPKDIEKYDWFINKEYSDCDDYRDGFRDWYGDNKHIKKTVFRNCILGGITETRTKMNLKQKKLVQRRKNENNHLSKPCKF